MTTPTLTSSTDSQMYNNIMAAGSKDRPPMLATGRYPQWRSRFLRYIDTRPNAIPKHTTVETPMNMSPANKAHFEAEKEAIHLILIGIGDEIYSTVDACQTAQEMWKAIERLQQGESLNIQDVKTNLFWEFGKFTSHDGETIESYYTRFYKLMNEMIRNNLIVATLQVNVQFLQQLQPEWSRFVTIVKQQHKLNEVSYHKLFDILKQYQKEVNELRAERLDRNANPLALVATAQAKQDPYYQTSKSHKPYAPSSKPLIPTRTHTTTRYKGKEIAKPITPPSETASEEDNGPEQAQRDNDMQKNLALIAKYFKKIYKPTNNNLRTCSNPRNKNVDTTPRENVGSPVVQQSGIQCFNCKKFGHFAKECRKLKREVPKADSGTDSEPLEQVQNDAGYNVFANDLQHFEQSESISNTCLVETDDSNVIPDSPNMCEDDIQNDQNDVESDDERVVLANLKLDECKNILVETSNALGESISVRDSCLVALQTKQTEFEKYKAFNDHTVDYDKLEHQFRALTAQDMEILIQTCLMPLTIKTQNDSFIFVHELKQEMHADLKYVESLKKEINELESDKAEFSNMYDMILQECVPHDVMCSYFLSLSDLDALAKLQCLYLHKVKECDCLVQNLSKQTESVSKEVHNELLQRFAKVEKHLISLEIALQKCKEQVKNDTVWNEKASNVFRKEREQYIKIQDLKAQLQDKNIAIRELNKLIEKGKEKSVETKFDKPSVIVQLIIFIVDSGCTKHMTSNLKLLCNFVEKFLGTVRFGNDQFEPILGYGDLVHGNITINRVYYVEGLNRNLFSVGQFCDADLEVAFRKSTCFVRDLQGNDLLT
nr:integrase, catalytic region, zinc finger, CCHC-type, peptidase aspartic, catalytic [Tanacetum cinerariifolium]